MIRAEAKSYIETHPATGKSSVGPFCRRAYRASVATGTLAARTLPACIAAISDGKPTDNFEEGLSALFAQPHGRKAVRIGIGIGQDCDFKTLEHFMDNPEVKPLRANNAQYLIKHIRWVTTAVIKVISASQSRNTSKFAVNVPLPGVPTPSSSATAVW